MVHPVRGYGISTPYRAVGSWWKMCGWHTGVDIAAPLGTPIYAPISGTIRHRNYGDCFGKFQFVISPSKGQPFAEGEVLFAHTRNRLPDGTEVKYGQLISYVGREGCSSGPHLHMQYHITKQQISCGVIRNPQPIIDWRPTAPPSSGWKYPAGTKVYEKYLGWDGHLLNDDQKSISIGCWQEMMDKHPLEGGANIKITEQWDEPTALETQKCQSQHIPPPDQPLKAVFVGPKQFEHVKAATKSPYIWVADTEPPVVEKPARPSLVYPNAIWDPIEKNGGGWFTGLRPFKGTAKKVTLHTTETAAKPDWKQQQAGIPHFTMDLSSGSVWQHLPLDISAYTLKGGENSPNSDSGLNIQIEMIGYTRECATWSDDKYLRIRLMLEWLGSNLGIPVVCPFDFVSPPRLDWDQWEVVSGVLGHCHATYNDHGDPTGLDKVRLLATPEKPEPPPVGTDYITRVEFDDWRNQVGRVMEELIEAWRYE